MSARLRTALGTATTAAAVLWWAPTLLILAGAWAGPRLRMAGITYRIRRARRLIERGAMREAERTLVAIQRDAKALAWVAERAAL